MQKQVDEARAVQLRLSATVFQPALDDLIWRSLATQAGLVPPASAPPDSDVPTSVMTPHADFDFLQVPWEVRNNELLVKGTDLKFAFDDNGGPTSKYAALFDTRHEFDSLRVSFLHAACGHRLTCLEDALAECVSRYENMDEHVVAGVLRRLEPVMEYMNRFSEHFDVSPSICDSPPLFAEEAWPLYVDSVCDRKQQYYLSANELLLVCELYHQNVGVFGTSGGSAKLLGAITGHDRCNNVLVALHVGRSASRVRSHFQRLVLLSDLKKTERAAEQEDRNRAEAQARGRELAAMSAADIEAMHYRSWMSEQLLREQDRN